MLCLLFTKARQASLHSLVIAFCIISATSQSSVVSRQGHYSYDPDDRIMTLLMSLIVSVRPFAVVFLNDKRKGRAGETKAGSKQNNKNNK